MTSRPTKTYDVDFRFATGGLARWTVNALSAEGAERRARATYGKSIIIVDIRVR